MLRAVGEKLCCQMPKNPYQTTTSPIKKREEKNSRNESQNSFWDRYWGPFAQLLAQLRSQVLSRSVGTGRRETWERSCYWPNETVPQVFAKFNTVWFSSRFSWLWKSPKSNLLSEKKNKTFS